MKSCMTLFMKFLRSKKNIINYKSHHRLPGIAKVNGLHLANTNRDSTSCKLSRGLPVSRGGSMTPALAVASL